MILDTTINLPTIITLLSVIVGAVIWLVRLEGQVGTNRSDNAELAKAVSAVQALVVLHKEQFHQYQLEAAQKFTTREIITEIKHDFSTELNRVEQRIETQINRLVEARP